MARGATTWRRAAACCTIWPRTRWTWRAIFWGARSSRVSATRVTSAESETVAVTGEIDGGVVLSATWASGTIDDDVVEVVGTEGAVRVALRETSTLTSRGQSVPGAAARLMRAAPTPQAVAFGLAKRRAPWHDPSFEAALDNFVRAARGRTAVVPGIDEGWHSARASTPIAEAVRTGRTVALGDGRPASIRPTHDIPPTRPCHPSSP